MRQISVREQNDLLAILAAHYDELIAIPGVHHLDVGYRIKGGKHTEELTVRAHVRKKLPVELMTDTRPLPTKVSDVGVDVIPSAKRQHQVHRDIRFNPLTGGVQTGNQKLAPSGTLGLIVEENETNDPLGLSNYHVWVRTAGMQGDPVDQPHLEPPDDVIGTLWKWDATLDCAVAKLDKSRPFQLFQALDVPSKVTGIAEPLVGMPVMKSGMATLLTYGLVDGVGLEMQDLTVVPDPAKPARNNEISMEGDSGSVWIHTGTLEAIGLHHSGERTGYPERAWASRMTNVRDAMNFHI